MVWPVLGLHGLLPQWGRRLATVYIVVSSLRIQMGEVSDVRLRSVSSTCRHSADGEPNADCNVLVALYTLYTEALLPTDNLGTKAIVAV